MKSLLKLRPCSEQLAVRLAADPLIALAQAQCRRGFPVPPPFLSKAVRPDAISHLDPWTGEYALGTQAAQALGECLLTGWTLRPLLHPRGQTDSGCGMHLTTRDLLPEALEAQAPATLKAAGAEVLA